MTFSKSLVCLALLLTVPVLALSPQEALAHTDTVVEERAIASGRILTIGPLNAVVFRVSAR